MVCRTRVVSSADRNALRSSGSPPRSAQRFAILVNICMAVAPIARARGGAWCVPPAIDTCAPRSTSSSHVGARQWGSFALSVLALNAGFLRDAFRSGGATFLVAGFVTLALRFFDAVFAIVFALRDFRAPARLLVLRRLAMECLSAARTVDWARLVECVGEVATAAALRLERLVATDDAIAVVRVVGTEPTADGAVLGDPIGHRRNLAARKVA